MEILFGILVWQWQARTEALSPLLKSSCAPHSPHLASVTLQSWSQKDCEHCVHVHVSLPHIFPSYLASPCSWALPRASHPRHLTCLYWFSSMFNIMEVMPQEFMFTRYIHIHDFYFIYIHVARHIKKVFSVYICSYKYICNIICNI